MNNKFASFSSRLQATLADGFVIAIITYLINLIISLVFQNINNIKELMSLLILSISIYIVISSLYCIISWIKFDGATIGKKLAGIKIIKTDGSPLTIGTAIMRIIGYWISTLFIGLGYLWVLWDKNKQGWHDKIAKTYVIETGVEPRKKLLWALIIGFFIITILNNGAVKQTDQNISFVNPDGSTAKNITRDSILAQTLYEGKGTINNEEYWGNGFELYEKANINIEVETDYNASVCVMHEEEFLKFQNGNGYKCVYEVTKSPSVTQLEAGKYIFVIIPINETINYSASLKATKITN